MSVTRTSAIKGIVPNIIFSINDIINSGFRIRTITLKIVGRPFVQEQEELISCPSFKEKSITKFFNPQFDTKSYSAVIVNKFKGCTETLLKTGCFAELTCKATIEGSYEVDNGTVFRTEEIKSWRKGYLTSPTWQDGLFSTSSEDSPSHHPTNNDAIQY